MAKKRSRSGQFVASGTTTRTVRATPQTSIIKVSAPRVAAPKKHRRRSSTKRSSGGLLGFAGSHGRTSTIIAAALLGYVHKQGWLHKIPVIGTAGPITSFALLGWGVEEIGKMKLPPLVHDMITNALAISAFTIGSTGMTSIVGSDTVLGDGGSAYPMPGGAVFFD